MLSNGDKPRIFVRDLLFLEVLKATSFSEPKNSREINAEIQER